MITCSVLSFRLVNMKHRDCLICSCYLITWLWYAALASVHNPSQLALHSCPASTYFKHRWVRAASPHISAYRVLRVVGEHRSKDKTRIQRRGRWAKSWVPSIQACGPRGTSACRLLKGLVEALGAHTLLGMPAPRVCKLGFARWHPRCATGNPPGPGVRDERGCAARWGWVPLQGAGSSWWEPRSRPRTSPSLTSQCLLPAGESRSLCGFGGGILIQMLKKKLKSPSSAKILFKEGQRSPAVWLNNMDESWASVMLYQ